MSDAMNNTTRNCHDCRWWREQAGSAHAMCPRQSDFSFSWRDIAAECDIFAPVLPGETIERGGVNQFMVWAGHGGLPTKEQIAAWFAARAGQPAREGE